MHSFLIALACLLLAGHSSYAIKDTVTVDSSRYDGFVIALAWPKAWAKEAGDGYDRLMRGLGFNDDGFYRVGHAALILVNAADSSCHYMDFGRYHTPKGFGRVRDEVTDHELAITTKAQIDRKRILNLDAILCEVQSNASTHASGPMYASYVRIDFASAYSAAMEIQQRGMLPYGPFEKDGFNCSRFVRNIILAGEPNWAHALRLQVVPMITPTTLYPVSALYHWTKVPGCLDEHAEQVKQELSSLPDSVFHGVLPQPFRPVNVPTDAQWLAGESSGSWFKVEIKEEAFYLNRYAADGQLECQIQMEADGNSLENLKETMLVTYPSHCKEVTLAVGIEILKLRAIASSMEP